MPWSSTDQYLVRQQKAGNRFRHLYSVFNKWVLRRTLWNGRTSDRWGDAKDDGLVRGWANTMRVTVTGEWTWVLSLELKARFDSERKRTMSLIVVKCALNSLPFMDWIQILSLITKNRIENKCFVSFDTNIMISIQKLCRFRYFTLFGEQMGKGINGWFDQSVASDQWND